MRATYHILIVIVAIVDLGLTASVLSGKYKDLPGPDDNVDEEQAVPSGGALASQLRSVSSRLKQNSVNPSSLVRDLLHFYVVQLNIYSRGSRASGEIKMRCSNSTMDLLKYVVDNFKRALREETMKRAKGETEETSDDEADSPDSVLQLSEINSSSSCPISRNNSRLDANLRISSYISGNNRSLADQYVAAKPLVEQLVRSIEGVHRRFMSN